MPKPPPKPPIGTISPALDRRQKIAAAILAYDTGNIDAHRLQPLDAYVKIPAQLWTAARSIAELVK